MVDWYDEFHQNDELGCATIFHLMLGKDAVVICGKYISAITSGEIHIEVIESSSVFQRGRRIKINPSFIICTQQGPKMFNSAKEDQHEYWISQLDNPHFKEQAEIELAHYDKYGWFSS